MKEPKRIYEVEHHPWGFYYETLRKAVALVTHSRRTLRQQFGANTELQIKEMGHKVLR